jgi:hypothetical protein
MTTYTEAQANSASYGERISGETIWDAGSTEWDISGNVSITDWDVTATAYSDESANTPTWAEE